MEQVNKILLFIQENIQIFAWKYFNLMIYLRMIKLVDKYKKDQEVVYKINMNKKTNIQIFSIKYPDKLVSYLWIAQNISQLKMKIQIKKIFLFLFLLKIFTLFSLILLYRKFVLLKAFQRLLNKFMMNFQMSPILIVQYQKRLLIHQDQLINSLISYQQEIIK
ncbi:transmembrane protein, putative (macronuclear) [Tetrahymena thermophila SB210]|uniref:Transmembrane protein, putative n=1 Tax=Tetrahymena thermophila (strain SB210) TaxID=312017 RepID=W7X159_TETTS|nr:transmembrane protein, putative [Tetrahymena thermophila SB210]EWS72945.1 transmembrane protein, putative [Tetrahymena thermophila SB210]|eukprot:XP_012654512.1 transmembrane protein, putative [Tetrahymena thermophila SB210]